MNWFWTENKQKQKLDPQQKHFSTINLQQQIFQDEILRGTEYSALSSAELLTVAYSSEQLTFYQNERNSNKNSPKFSSCFF